MKPETNIPEREKYLFVQFEPFFSFSFPSSFLILSLSMCLLRFWDIFVHIWFWKCFLSPREKKVISISYETVWMVILEYISLDREHLPKHKVLGKWSITEQWTDRRASWTVNSRPYWLCWRFDMVLPHNHNSAFGTQIVMGTSNIIYRFLHHSRDSQNHLARILCVC